MRYPANGAVWLAGIVGALLLAPGCTSSTFPEVSDDGLERVARTTDGAIYEAPEFDLRDFRQIVVDDCTVQFRDNWQRDQNLDRGPSRRVTDEDMQRITRELADACRRIFAAELSQLELGGGDAPEDGGILTVRPAIVDLDIAAPDLQTPGVERSYTTTAGRMTLRLELVDTGTDEIVGRVIDRRQARNTATPRITTGVSNRIEAELILEQWAKIVREHFEASLE